MCWHVIHVIQFIVVNCVSKMIVEGNQPLAHTFSSSVIGWICYIICINLFKIYRYKSNLNRSKALVKLLQLLAISTINHIFWDFDSGTITPLIFVHSVQMEYYECKTRFYSESIHQNVSSLLANNYLRNERQLFKGNNRTPQKSQF